MTYGFYQREHNGDRLSGPSENGGRPAAFRQRDQINRWAGPSPVNAKTNKTMTLQDWIRREGIVISQEFLKVDGFLNHRIDPAFIETAAKQLAKSFPSQDITCVLTAEAAGNAIAYEVARQLRACALYAKKGRASTMNNPLLRTVRSPTKGVKAELAVSEDYLGPQERVLIVDDFLYHGHTSAALAQMVRQSDAELIGFGFIIAKESGGGRQVLAQYDVPIVTLVSVVRLDPERGEIVFGEENQQPV